MDEKVLEEQLVALLRRREITGRAVALADEHLRIADGRHQEVETQLAAVNGELILRYRNAAATIGLLPGEGQ